MNEDSSPARERAALAIPSEGARRPSGCSVTGAASSLAAREVHECPPLDGEMTVHGEQGPGDVERERTDAHRQEVLTVLRRHGLSGTAATAVWIVGRRLVRETRRRRLEHGAMLDALTGDQVGPVITGTNDRLDTSRQLAAFRPGAAHAHVHTHPANSAFSDLDAAFLIAWPDIRVIVVAALDGHWYVMSKLEGVAGWIDVVGKFRAELADLLADAEVRAVERPHVIWLRIAVRLGLRYDRAGSP